MGQRQSQEINNFVDTYVNTNAISEVISRYASRTNSVSTNVQDVAIRITAGEVTGPINVSQEIESYINVEQLINRANITELTNDLQQTVEEQLRGAILSSTDFLADLFAIPANQQIRQEVLNNLSTYVSNVINTDTIDELLLSSSNYQKGNLVIDASTISGPITFTQRIQSNIMAENIVEQVIQNALQNREVVQLATRIEAQEERQATAPLSDIARGIGQGAAAFGAQAGAGVAALTSNVLNIGLIIVGIIILIVGIVLAVFLKVNPAIKWTLVIVAVVLALIIGGIGVFRLVATRTAVRTVAALAGV